MIKILITIFLFWICIVSCLQSEKNSDSKVSISVPQTQVQNLVDKFKLTVNQEKNIEKQDSIRIKYANKFYDLLSSIYIDSIRVHIDSVIVDNLTVVTAFHCNNEIAFSSSLTFQKEMDSTQDSLFNFMKGLKPGLDTLVNFAYLGNHEVSLPNSLGTPIIKIFAYPIPIWLTQKE